MRHLGLALASLFVWCALGVACREKAAPPPAREEPRSGAIPQPLAASAAPAAAPASSLPATQFPIPPEAKTSTHGVIHHTTRAGSGKQKPSRADTVSLAYRAFKADGAELDSRSPDEPLTVAVKQLTPGLADSVMDMVPGEQRRLWLRWDLVKSPGVPTDIKLLDPPFGDLTVDLELVSVGGAAPSITANRPSELPPTRSGSSRR